MRASTRRQEAVTPSNWLYDYTQKRCVLIRAPVLQAAFRGATAALRLGEFDKAAEVCSRGLQRNPAAPELVKLLEVIVLGHILCSLLRPCESVILQLTR